MHFAIDLPTNDFGNILGSARFPSLKRQQSKRRLMVSASPRSVRPRNRPVAGGTRDYLQRNRLLDSLSLDDEQPYSGGKAL